MKSFVSSVRLVDHSCFSCCFQLDVSKIPIFSVNEKCTACSPVMGKEKNPAVFPDFAHGFGHLKLGSISHCATQRSVISFISRAETW